MAIETTKDLVEVGANTVKKFRKMTPKVTGKSRKAIKAKVTQTDNGPKLDIDVPGYILTGRGPGKQPPLENISRWANVVGVQSAFAVAVSIGQKGTRLFQEGGREDEYTKVWMEEVEKFEEKQRQDLLQTARDSFNQAVA